MPRKKIWKTCKKCLRKVKLEEQQKYCSRMCYFSTRPIGGEYRDCKQCGKKFKVWFSMIRNGWGKGKFCSKGCYHTFPKSAEFRRRISLAFRGANHPNWKGGATKGRKDRNRKEYKEWRKSVFERDEYTCQDCGVKNKKGLGHSVALEADHIAPWVLYPESRYEVENGRTLCTFCHYKRKKETLEWIFLSRVESMYDLIS